jgi:glutathione synthase/RimK-type ligase-like ATP-grasp enzyme
MILLWGIPSEPPLRLAAEAAARAGVEHMVVNQRHAADHDLDVDLADPSRGTLVVDGVAVALRDVDGIYVRIMEPDRLPEHRAGAPADRVERSAAFHAMLLAWTEVAPCRVANRTAPMASNGSKPYQAQQIHAVGFATPPTVVTNDPAEVLRFEARHGPLVYKSTSSVRSIVSPLDDHARQRLDQLRVLPTQFQRRETGTDIRVHVVGRRVLAARIASGALDYRYAGRDGLGLELEPTQIPDHVADRCRALSAELDLPFCGIDLCHRTDGSWLCYEVNPSPGYSWYEEATGLPISDALVAWLSSAE